MTPILLTHVTHDIVPRGVALAVGASVLTLALGYPLPALLRHLGAGKAVSPYQPAGHRVKTGTPSMAGLLFNGVALVLGAVAVAPSYPDVWLLLALLLAGALLGFLWHNVHPARFFMGDTGALALGAVLAGAALLTGDVVVLLVIGGVFVAVALSVIVQLAYYRSTGGRRLFRASPLHHHFELCGWSESRIVHRFWLAGIVAAVVSVGLALIS